MVLTLLLKIAIEIVMRSLRYNVRNEQPVLGLVRDGKPFVLVFWHGSMTHPWWRMRHRNASALVSLSKDGEILTRLLRSWGYHVIRGSSSKQSKEAMDMMRGVVRDGYTLCVTPDGPRGPYHEMKMGAIRVAQTTGVPLVMVTVGYSRFKRLKRSWDRFEIPLPFSAARVEYSNPILIDPSLSGEALDEKRADLEKAMHAQYRRVTLNVDDAPAMETSARSNDSPDVD